MGNKKINRFFSVLARISVAAAIAATMISLPSSATGSSYDEQIAEKEEEIKKKQQENENRRSQIDDITGDIGDNKDKMEKISVLIDGVKGEIVAQGELITLKQSEIEEKQNDIENVEAEIADNEKEIQKKQNEIIQLEQENKRNLEKFAKLARALYINDTSNTLPLLEGSDDWYSFFVYTDVVQNISSQNLRFMNSLLDSIRNQEDMITQLETDIQNLENKKTRLENEKTQLEDKMTELEQEKKDLESYADSQYNDLYSLAAKNEELSTKVSNLKWAISATNQEVEELNEEIKELIRRKQAANSGQSIYSTDGFRWPLDKKFQMITTYFGWDAWRSGNHYGIDVGNAGIGGQNIYAAQGGTVITAYGDGGYHGGFGNYVIIDHGGGISTLYAHCSGVTVYEGQQVNKGDVIGYVGSTGWSTGNHLHFEVRTNGVPVNPFNYGYEYV